MGRSIDVSVYNTKELIQKLQEWGAHDIDLLMSILKECGTFLANESQYVLSSDFTWERGPADVLHELLEAAFAKDDVHGVFYKCSTIDIITATEDEVGDIAERLGIRLSVDGITTEGDLRG